MLHGRINILATGNRKIIVLYDGMKIGRVPIIRSIKSTGSMHTGILVISLS